MDVFRQVKSQEYFGHAIYHSLEIWTFGREVRSTIISNVKSSLAVCLLGLLRR